MQKTLNRKREGGPIGHVLPMLFYRKKIRDAFAVMVDALQETPACFPCAIAEKLCLGAEMAGVHPVEGLDDLAFNVPREALPEFFELATVVSEEALKWEDERRKLDSIRAFVWELANVVNPGEVKFDKTGKLVLDSLRDAELLQYDPLLDAFGRNEQGNHKWAYGTVKTEFSKVRAEIQKVEHDWSTLIHAWKKAHRFYRLLRRCHDGGPRGSFAEWAGSSEALRCLRSVSSVLNT